jgi:hypothetical protein
MAVFCKTHTTKVRKFALLSRRLPSHNFNHRTTHPKKLFTIAHYSSTRSRKIIAYPHVPQNRSPDKQVVADVHERDFLIDQEPRKTVHF